MKESLAGEPVLKRIPLGDLRPSKFNHRKTINEAQLAELAASIARDGIYQPLSVRPVIKKGAIEFYEIGSGERRFHAATRADLDSVPCLVREMDEAAFVTLVQVENLQRADVHPLEEAEGYVDLMQVVGADVPKVSSIVGKEERYVRDRLQLLKLTPTAKKMYRDERFTLGHAIEISRQGAELQDKLIDPLYGSLWLHDQEDGLFTEQEEELRRHGDSMFGMVPITVPALKAWINSHVRFDPKAEIVADLFPKTAELLRDAADMKLKTIAITYSRRVAPEVKGGRIYGPDDWRRADGTDDAPRCNSSDLGLVVGGPHWGEAFAVCVDKKHCDTHWADEIKTAAKQERVQAKTEKAASAGDLKAQKKLEKEAKAREAAAATRAQQQKIDAQALPLLLATSSAAIAKAPVSACGVKGVVGKLTLEFMKRGGELSLDAAAVKRIPKSGNPDAVVRFFAMEMVNWVYDLDDALNDAKDLGVNGAKIVKDVTARIAKEDKAAAAAAEKKAK